MFGSPNPPFRMSIPGVPIPGVPIPGVGVAPLFEAFMRFSVLGLRSLCDAAGGGRRTGAAF